ncbi:MULTISPECIES: 5'-methylthioadenosine/S-adenosylhomocysteine nucleosidase family protein [Micromonospora]|uniref:Nucleoside phosphorylase n=1 Tax=Micromonospora yangpuensis TaxID=683228 RepID=A0A1C6VGD3_9ACTN|nr:5'-methylthioadenosine/S-adenosylhomocysteine nucleosidase [Micromonospora yangpuensis]GGL98818.1 hypothetical protein GCM10012279_15330 [Micromonospora yangpuensis]SCL65393.1 Nucleoside phosphorylase [Micromonospora yangpuensis]
MSSEGGYRLGLLVALGEEFRYVQDTVGPMSSFVDQGRQMYRFTFPGSRTRGLALPLHAMGPVAAALGADLLVRSYGVSVVALVGTAGGLDPDLRLGDVVIAAEVDSYLYRAKAVPTPDGTSFALRTAGTSWRLRGQLAAFVNNFPFGEWSGPTYRRWRADRVADHPDGAADPPKALVGPVASGDLVGAAEQFTAWLRGRNRAFTALECEAAGAAAAVDWHEGVDLLVLRGVSDHADPGKAALDAQSDGSGAPNVWRRYATTNAVMLLGCLVSDPDFPWSTLPTRAPSADAGVSGTGLSPAEAAAIGISLLALGVAVNGSPAPDPTTTPTPPGPDVGPTHPGPDGGGEDWRHGTRRSPPRHRLGDRGGPDQEGPDDTDDPDVDDGDAS